MAAYPPPTNINGTFNSSNFINDDLLTVSDANALYLGKQGDQVLNGNLSTKQVNFTKVATLGDPNMSWSSDAFSQIYVDINSDINLVNSANSLIVKDANTSFSKPVLQNDSTDATNRLTGSVVVAGGLATSSQTDATSSTSGNSLTVGGGAAVAKKLFVGDNVSITGNLTIAQQPNHIRKSTTNQSINDATLTTLTLPSATVVINQGNITWSTDRFVIPKNGTYLLSAYVVADGGTTPCVNTILFSDLNSVNIYAQRYSVNSQTTLVRETLTATQYLTVGSEVFLRFNKDTAGAGPYNVSTAQFSCTLIY